MKQTLLIITVLMLIVGCSKPIDEASLIDKDGTKYHPETKESYTGKAIEYNPVITWLHGSVLAKSVGSYKNGGRDGIWTVTDTFGKKVAEITYKMGHEIARTESFSDDADEYDK